MISHPSACVSLSIYVCIPDLYLMNQMQFVPTFFYSVTIICASCLLITSTFGMIPLVNIAWTGSLALVHGKTPVKIQPSPRCFWSHHRVYFCVPTWGHTCTWGDVYKWTARKHALNLHKQTSFHVTWYTPWLWWFETVLQSPSRTFLLSRLNSLRPSGA